MAKSRIKRGSRVYVYERENYRDKDGKVKHRKAVNGGVKIPTYGGLIFPTQINSFLMHFPYNF